MDVESHVRVVLWMPRDLYVALEAAAHEADKDMPDALRARLSASLTVPVSRLHREKQECSQ